MTYPTVERSANAGDKQAIQDSILESIALLGQAWADQNPKKKEIDLPFVAALMLVGNALGLSDEDVTKALA